MKSLERKFILFESDLFVFSQRDEALDAWRVGGDCAGWFYTSLLAEPTIAQSLEPVMEDWGWTMALQVEKARVWIHVWAHLQKDNCWVLGLEVRKTFPWLQPASMVERAATLVADALERAVAGEPRMRQLGWFGENPVDS